jgi:hypothetical protein
VKPGQNLFFFPGAVVNNFITSKGHPADSAVLSIRQ